MSLAETSDFPTPALVLPVRFHLDQGSLNKKVCQQGMFFGRLHKNNGSFLSSIRSIIKKGNINIFNYGKLRFDKNCTECSPECQKFKSAFIFIKSFLVPEIFGFEFMNIKMQNKTLVVVLSKSCEAREAL